MCHRLIDKDKSLLIYIHHSTFIFNTTTCFSLLKFKTRRVNITMSQIYIGSVLLVYYVRLIQKFKLGYFLNIV